MKQIHGAESTISRRTLMRLAGGAAAFSSTRTFALVNGRVSGTASGQEPGGPEPPMDWQPVFFHRGEALAVARLTETILPRTDTPGAIDADVPAYVDLVISLESESMQARFRDRLEALQRRCRKEHGGRDLLEASSGELTELLGRISDDVVDPADEDPDLRALFRQLKQHTVVGYYTSLEGRTEELGLPAAVQRMQWQGCTGAGDHGGAR